MDMKTMSVHAQTPKQVKKNPHIKRCLRAKNKEENKIQINEGSKKLCMKLEPDQTSTWLCGGVTHQVNQSDSPIIMIMNIKV